MQPKDLKDFLDGTESEPKPTLQQKLGWILGVVLVWAMMSAIVWVTWNYVMPKLGLPKIGFFESVALYILCGVLFRKHLAK